MKVKVKVKAKPGKSGTLLARVPVTVAHTAKPEEERLYQTRAEIITHIRRGSRPTTFRLRRAR